MHRLFVRRISVVVLLALAPLVSVLVQPAEKQEQVVYVTKTGTKYHRGSCSSLRASKIEMPLAEAAKRYGRCVKCPPPVPPRAAATPAPAIQSFLTQRGAEPATSLSTRIMVTRTGKKHHRERCRTLRAGGIASTLAEAAKPFRTLLRV